MAWLALTMTIPNMFPRAGIKEPYRERERERERESCRYGDHQI
jgi:hypothetical protein